jgi:hypothetical protein
MTEQQPKQWRLPQLRLYSVEEINRVYAVNESLLGLLIDINLALENGGLRRPKGWIRRIKYEIAKATGEASP